MPSRTQDTPTTPPEGEAPTKGEQPEAEQPPAVDQPVTEPRPEPPSEAARILGADRAAVVLRQHWTDADGKAHAPDETVTVDASTALTLIGTKWATRVQPDAETPAEGNAS